MLRVTIQADTYFTIIPEWILYSDVSAQAVRVYGVLRRYADAQGKCHPSRKTIAERCRTSVATVDRAVSELIEIHALTVEHRFVDDPAGRKVHTSNRYTLHSLPANRVGGWTAGDATSPAHETTPHHIRSTPGRTGDEQTRAILNESQETEVPPLVVATVTGDTFTARTVAGHWVDTYRAVHGTEPPGQSIKRVAQAAKQLIGEGREPDLLLSAAADAATGGHANLASSITYLLASNRRNRSEPRGFDGIRQFLAEDERNTGL